MLRTILNLARFAFYFHALIENFLRVLLVAVTSGPALELCFRPAAELQKFLPVLFKEVEHAGNGGVSGSYRYQIPRDADRYWGVSARYSF